MNMSQIMMLRITCFILRTERATLFHKDYIIYIYSVGK